MIDRECVREYVRPGEIERRSMEIIERELRDKHLLDPCWTDGELAVVKRCIHTSADFDYARNLAFSENAVSEGIEALRRGAPIVTDTSMAAAGISKKTLEEFGGRALCFIGEESVAEEAKARDVTRSTVCMERAARLEPRAVYAIGNAPTALIRLSELIREKKAEPALVIGVPVGFVNVVESKELFMSSGVAHIVARGRKGGSNIAAAICNCLLYRARDGV